MKMSVRNAAFQRFETLKRNREKRFQQKLAFVEGVQPIEQALAHGWHFRALGYADGARRSGWADDMLKKARPDEVYEIAPELLKELSDRENPCELVGLLEMREDGLARLTECPPRYLLFDRPLSPGNLGSIVRSADAFAMSGVLTTGHSADFYDPQCIRASVGTLFARPFAALDGPQAALDWLDSLPVRPQIIGTSAHGTAQIMDCDLSGPTLLLVGNETFGLSKAWKERCDLLVRIPIFGAASSLNAASAASVCLYEMARQTLAKQGGTAQSEE